MEGNNVLINMPPSGSGKSSCYALLSCSVTDLIGVHNFVHHGTKKLNFLPRLTFHSIIR